MSSKITLISYQKRFVIPRRLCRLLAVAVAVLVAAAAVLPGRTGRGTNVGRITADIGVGDGLVGASANVGSSVRVDFALGGAAAVLVDLEGVDAPVSLVECGRVVLHVIDACVSLGCAGARRPSIASPVTTEGNVEDLIDPD